MPYKYGNQYDKNNLSDIQLHNEVSDNKERSKNCGKHALSMNKAAFNANKAHFRNFGTILPLSASRYWKTINF